jgi:hypothetical protein
MNLIVCIFLVLNACIPICFILFFPQKIFLLIPSFPKRISKPSRFLFLIQLLQVTTKLVIKYFLELLLTRLPEKILNSKWSSIERDQLKKFLLIFGYGRWNKIRKYSKTSAGFLTSKTDIELKAYSVSFIRSTSIWKSYLIL